MLSDKARKQYCQRIADRLKDARLQRGFSMTEVAVRAGLSQQMVSYVERGLRSPTLETLVRLADAIEIELGELFAPSKD